MMICRYTDVSVLENEDVFYSFYQRIPWAERREAIDRCRRKEDRCLHLGASLLLLAFLSRISENENRETLPAISYSPKGKPYLAEYPGIHFSLSHTRNLAAVCFGSSPVGIDAEHIHGRYEKIAAFFFTEEERQLIFSSKDKSLEAHNFLKIWTRKEAWLKMTGDGLTKDLKSVPVWPDAPAGYRFYEHTDGDCVLTACCSGQEPFERFEKISLLSCLSS